MQTIDVSVIIPVRNRSEYLPGGIASILDQDWSGTLEIICIDDGSETDPFSALSDPPPPQVRLLRQAHSGVGAARQLGLDQAAGRYIAFNDDDDLWAPDKLRIALDALERHPHLDMVFGDGREFNDKGDAPETILGPYREAIKRQSHRLALETDAPLLYRCDRDTLARRFMTNTPLYFQTVLARRGFLDRIGGMNPLTRSCGDCLDFAVRATHGGVIGYIDQSMFRLRRGHSHMTGSRQTIDRELTEFFEVFPGYPDSLKDMLKPWLPALLSNKGWIHFRQGEYRDAANAYREARRYGRLTMPSTLKLLLATLLSGLPLSRPASAEDQTMNGAAPPASEPKTSRP